MSNAYYIPSVFNELGFPYCFCHQFTTYPVDRPEGFDRDAAEAWDSAPGSTGEGAAVNVIMVMNEAFSDITDSEVFVWEEDPLPNLHAMQSDPHAVTGHVVVPISDDDAHASFRLLARTDGDERATRIFDWVRFRCRQDRDE